MIKSSLFFILLITGLFAQPNWSATITASGGYDGSSYDLTFGFHPEATDGQEDGALEVVPGIFTHMRRGLKG